MELYRLKSKEAHAQLGIKLGFFPSGKDNIYDASNPAGRQRTVCRGQGQLTDPMKTFTTEAYLVRVDSTGGLAVLLLDLLHRHDVRHADLLPTDTLPEDGAEGTQEGSNVLLLPLQPLNHLKS